MGIAHRPVAFGKVLIHTWSLEPYRQNCYLLHDTSSGESLIVDPGLETSFILSELKKLKTHPKAILLTHAHFDHIASIDAVRELYAIPCFLHQADQKIFRQAGNVAYTFLGLNLRISANISLFSDTHEGILGGLRYTSLSTPGHSPGSVAYVLEQFCVFSGDALFFQAIGSTDFPGSNLQDLVDSVGKILGKMPDQSVIFPGHGRPWNIGEARAWWSEASTAPPQLSVYGDIRPGRLDPTN